MTLLRALLRLGLVALTACAPAVAQDRADCPPVAAAPSAQRTAEIVAAARDRGFLWQLQKDGRTSWLYGTLHVGKLAWAVPGRTVTQALRSADTLALEIDLTDPSVARRAQAAMAPASAPALPATLRERLDRQAAAACVPAQALARLHPVMQVMTLSMLSGRRDGLDPSFGAEFSLAGAAQALQRPIVSLESVESQFALLLPADANAATALAERMLDQLESDTTRSGMRRMAEAWARGDLDELAAYEHWCDCVKDEADRAFLHRLNDGRNPALADAIDALHAQGRSVFAAVGALHMTGAQALPRLMAARGYAVQRMAFPR